MHQRFKQNFQYLLFITITLTLLILNFSVYFGFSFSGMIQLLINRSFNVSQNIMLYNEFDKLPLPIYLYAAIFICSTLVFITFKFLSSRHPDKFFQDRFKTHLLFSSFTVFVFITLIQTMSLSRVWSYNLSRYAPQNDASEFLDTPVHQSKLVADFYNSYLTGKHQAHFESDLDLSRDPGMLQHRSLAFFLYPIDIRNIHAEEKDTWIAFEKENARQHLPDGYRVLGEFNNKNIIAIRD